MKFLTPLLCFCCCVWSLFGWAEIEATEPLLATIDADVYEDYQAFVAERDPLSITNYAGEGSRRDVVEVLLLQQALALGGMTEPLAFKIVDGYRDSLQVLAKGDAVLRATPAWKDDCSDTNYFVSDAVIRLGEFQVGLYTRPKNQRQLQNLELPLASLSAVTNYDLKADVNTLKQLGIEQIFNVERWPTMVSMVSSGEADVILAPFQYTDGMVMDVEGIRLLPITGVKVALADSRHWVVSRADPRGPMISEALERGLAVLRERGTVVRAYTESGFFHPQVKDWSLLNPVLSANINTVAER